LNVRDNAKNYAGDGEDIGWGILFGLARHPVGSRLIARQIRRVGYPARDQRIVAAVV
jgi:hypothetical protein